MGFLRCLTVCVLLSWIFLPPFAAADSSTVPVNVNVGYVIDSFSGIAPDEMKIAIKILFETRFKMKFPQFTAKAILFSDIDSAVDAIKKGQIDGLGMMTLDYIMTKDKNNLIPIRNASLGNSASTSFVFLVKQNNFESLQMLRDKKIIMEKGGHGDVAHMWLDTILMKQSLPESEIYFNSVERIDKSSRAVLKVFFEKNGRRA